MVQTVPLELQWCRAPALLIAITWNSWASGFWDQDTAMEPLAHCDITATSCGAQGADEQRGGIKLVGF